jgi:hypothetical protein
MRIPMTTLIDFATRDGQHHIDRYEVHCADFVRFRHSVMRVITNLNDADHATAKEYADQLRSIMSNWLTSPLVFDDSFARLFEDMGQLETIRRQWGNVIHDAVGDSVEALVKLQINPNPLRMFLASQLYGLVSENVQFRIYCHHRSRIHFESIFAELSEKQPSNDLFICSTASYRALEPSEVLVKVGPFRSKGWGAVPDALLTAPRSRSILQILWSGSKDEDGFGYDPTNRDDSQPTEQNYGYVTTANWVSRVRFVGDNNLNGDNDYGLIDDFSTYLQPRQADDCNRAVLIQIDNEYGVLLPPLGKVLSFDENLVIEQRVVSESLEVGMFVVFPEISGNQNYGLQVGDGTLSKVWRSRLSERYSVDPDDLVDRLRSSGISLASLHVCIQNWCRDPTTVIHAPMQKDHFRILINELDCGFDDKRIRQYHWWEYAWQEVKRSRGMAIQNGHDTQQVVEQVLLVGLRMKQLELSLNVTKDVFTVGIPEQIHEISIGGQYRCFRIKSIEGGFRTPDRELRMITELTRIDLWRE